MKNPRSPRRICEFLFVSKCSILRKQLTILLLLFYGCGFLVAQTPQNPEVRPVSLLPEPVFTPEGGFYADEVLVELISEGAKIYHTTDGSYPYPIDKNRYRNPFTVSRTTVVRALAVRGEEQGHPVSHTYFINEPRTDFPIVSLAVTPDMLFDPEKGLFVEGQNATDSLWKKPGANFWSRKEVAVNTEFFEPDSICYFRAQTGMRLFGGMSRLFPQKSLTVAARSRYGVKRIKHEVFGRAGLKKYKYLVLRNSGSDFGKSHFRDAFMTGLLKDWDLEIQDARPAHVYLNGEYWGIYNLREKVNRYFISDKFSVDKDSIDLMEHRMTRKRGSSIHYVRLLKYMLEHDLSDPAHYTYVRNQMDTKNFADYQIAQIFFDNQDAGGNVKYWRPQTEGGRWRWILYDTDWGFGLHNDQAYRNNSLEFHTKPDGTGWPNPAWSTFILRKLLENSEFRREFINRFADRLNTTFTAENISAEIDLHVNRLEPEIQRHLIRWRLSENRWRTHIAVMREFGEKRQKYVREHLRRKFDLGETNLLRISTTEGGKVVVNDNIKVKSERDFSGWYFSDMPVTVEAKSRLGYRFVGWEGADEFADERDLILRLQNKTTKLRAVFEKYDHPLAGKIIINEINCNNKKAGDWVEIYNYSDASVNLTDWTFTDSKNKFKLPAVSIPAKDYLILCEHRTRFGQVYPEAYRFVGDLGFGLSKRSESLALFDETGAWVDSTAYVLPPTDSVFTLNLLLPHLHNGDLENWQTLNGLGTPCAANPYYVESTLQAQRDRWLQIGAAGGVILMCVLLLFFRTNGRI